MANREYKDSLFRFLFNTPSAAFSLYRAIAPTGGISAADIQINTLNSILMDRSKNDLSFLVRDCYIVLFGHQSTWSQNLPLRCLWYISELYRHLIPDRKAMYREKLVPIPAPQFFAFCMGGPALPDRSTLRLSDAFREPSGFLELSVTVLNITYRPNRPVLQNCPLLSGYSYFVNDVETRRKQGLPLDNAIRQSMEHCAKTGILSEFISSHYEEVFNMVTLWYNENEAREEWREEGREKGMEEGMAKGMEKGRIESIRSLMKTMHLSSVEAMNALLIPPEQQKQLEPLL